MINLYINFIFELFTGSTNLFALNQWIIDYVVYTSLY